MVINIYDFCVNLNNQRSVFSIYLERRFLWLLSLTQIIIIVMSIYDFRVNLNNLNNQNSRSHQPSNSSSSLSNSTFKLLIINSCLSIVFFPM